MRKWEVELEKRVAWIRDVLADGAGDVPWGVVYGNSGGKDCTLASILCRAATEDVLGVIMPCHSSVNFGTDREHARLCAEQFQIPTVEVDVSAVKTALLHALAPAFDTLGLEGTLRDRGVMNVNPRLRMTVLYTLAQSRRALVCGTGNRSEYEMGYFTKWGDGAYDFNPISDLTATEVFDFLRFLGAPEAVVRKPPSAGLFEGQTDEAEMGVTYAEIDAYLLSGSAPDPVREKVDHARLATAHKRRPPRMYAPD